MITRRRFVSGIAASLAGGAFPALAQGTSLRMVLGFAAGGAVDVVGRAFGEPMRASLGRTMVVENKTGAGGALALQAVATAEPDGNMILMTPSSILTLRPFVENNLRVDPERQLAPISTACQFNFAVAVGPACPARSLEEFVTWCRANPKQASYGSPGIGTSPHIIGALFAQQTDIPLEHVAYRGGAQAMTDLYGGQLPAVFTTLPLLIPPYKAGRIRILASTASARIESVPEVHTFIEDGYPSLQFDEWFGVFAPAKTPAETIHRLNKAVRAAVNDKTTRVVLAKVEFTPRATSAAELGAMVKADLARWEGIVRRLGIKPRD